MSHCSKYGHDVGSCYQVHIYPNWWKYRGNRGVGGTRPGYKLYINFSFQIIVDSFFYKQSSTLKRIGIIILLFKCFFFFSFDLKQYTKHYCYIRT